MARKRVFDCGWCRIDYGWCHVDPLEKSSEVFPSGLDVLGRKWPRPSCDPDQFFATSLTWQQWAGVSELEAWQALALHFCLDPGRLGALFSNRQYLSDFLDQVGFLSDHPVAVFCLKRVFLAEDICAGRLECEEIREDCLASIVSVESFARYIKGAGVRRPLPAYDQKIDPAKEIPAVWGGMQHVTPLMALLAEMATHWRRVSEGGTVVAGDPTTFPDIEAMLLDRGGIPDYLCRDIARILGDGMLSPGRRKKRGPPH